ncbi:hypothetical protein ACI65C_004546 [Semiaphis heraclei]
MTSSEYSNKISKRKAWEEIVLIFSDPSDTEERKKFHERSIAQKQVPEKQEDDEDKLFCLSLLKDIKKVPETKRLKLKIDIYNLILQNQKISPPSRYHSPMYNHQYMPSNIVYPNYDTSTSYDTPARRYHQDYTTIEKNNYQHQLTSLSSPSPTPSNTDNTFIQYFENRLSPNEARHSHESKLLLQENSCSLLANAALNPTKRHIYYLHDEWRKKNFGSINAPLPMLQEKISTYAKIGVQISIKADKPWAVLIVTPIMKRSQQLLSSQEIIFVDSTSSVDTTSSTVTVMLTPSKVGAIPLAILIHEGQSEQSYIRAFSLLQEHFPLCYGAKEAPLAFMTDDSLAEKNALSSLWPTAQASIRVLKDILLHRTKAYNVVALVDFIVSIGEEYFTLRILNHAHCRHSETNRLHSKLCPNIVDLNVNDVKKISKCTYEVPSMSEKNVYYSINIENGLCTCKMGLSGSFCKHQAWIHKNIKIQSPNAPPVTLNERHELGILALGIEKCPKLDFFLGLKENLTQNVLNKTITLTSPNLDEHNLYKNTSNDVDVDTSAKLIQSDSFTFQNSENYKKAAAGVSNQDFPTTSNYASFKNNTSIENIESNSDILNIEKLKSRLKHVQNGSQFASLICSISNTACNINRRRGQIKVQPTSISRRKKGITRGSKRLSAGRKPNGHSTNIKKRPHNLTFNVANNQMNAKSHGNGH